MKKIALIFFTIATSINISLAIINQSRLSILSAVLFAIASASVFLASSTNGQKATKTKLAIDAVMLGIGVLLLSYLWVTLGRRGIMADETGTAGYTHWYEVMLGLVGILLAMAGAIRLLSYKLMTDASK